MRARVDKKTARPVRIAAPWALPLSLVALPRGSRSRSVFLPVLLDQADRYRRDALHPGVGGDGLDVNAVVGEPAVLGEQFLAERPVVGGAAIDAEVGDAGRNRRRVDESVDRVEAQVALRIRQTQPGWKTEAADLV